MERAVEPPDDKFPSLGSSVLEGLRECTTLPPIRETVALLLISYVNFFKKILIFIYLFGCAGS